MLRLPLALSLALLVAAVVTSAEPIREKEEDSYVGKKSVTQKEGVDYLWISEPEQEEAISSRVKRSPKVIKKSIIGKAIKKSLKKKSLKKKLLIKKGIKVAVLGSLVPKKGLKLVKKGLKAVPPLAAAGAHPAAIAGALPASIAGALPAAIAGALPAGIAAAIGGGAGAIGGPLVGPLIAGLGGAAGPAAPVLTAMAPFVG